MGIEDAGYEVLRDGVRGWRCCGVMIYCLGTIRVMRFLSNEGELIGFWRNKGICVGFAR